MTEEKQTPAASAGKPRKRSTPETAQSVNLHIGDDEELRTKILNILNVCRHNNKGITIPLSGALRYAINAGHNAIFGEEFDDAPEGAFDAFKERLEALKARRRGTPIPETTQAPPQRPSQHHSAEAGKTPAQIAREAAEAKGDAARGIGKPKPPQSQQ
ncbi:MAG TPA: hypothetical protein VK972_09385 [Wenzhouxiangella sp.]|nr:hypothetical protein [Wenzhouxiangella sp.]